MEQRTLPIRIQPVAGESLASWLDRYCFVLSTSRKDLYASVGLISQSAAGLGATDYSLRISDLNASRLAFATGVTTQNIHGLTLARYEGRGVVFRKYKQGVDIHYLWARGAGTRYCPACLKEDEGAWQLAWRLTWSFACTRHECLLLDLCDRCGLVPRTGGGITDTPQPSYCDNRRTGPYGDVLTCQRDLARVPLIRIPPTSPLLATQNWLNSIIDADDISSNEVARLLDDLKLLAGRALGVMTADELQSWTYSDAADVKFGIDPGRRRTGLFAPPSGVAIAHAVTLASMVMRTDEQSIYVPIIRRLRSAPDGRVETENPSGIVRDWGTPSPSLERKLLRSIDEYLGPHTALRYRTVSPSPSSPPRDQTQVLARTRSIPQRLWPGWTLRLSMEGSVGPMALQKALSIGALLPGSDRHELKVQHQALELPPNDHSFSYVFHSLSAHAGRAVMQALLVLASYLDNCPAPIDYHRRRQLALNQLLPASTWRDIAIDPIIRENPPDAARMYLAYRLTGSIIERPGHRGRKYYLIQNFIAATPTNILYQLDDYAKAFLVESFITEPLCWEPPLSLLDDIAMSAEPACSTDPMIEDAIGHGLVEPRLIRLAQEGADKPFRALRPETHSLRARLRQSLDRGDSIEDMASDLNKSERTIRHHLDRLSIRTQPAGSVQAILDEIREMYVDQRLTIREIADQTGRSWAVVQRLVHLSGAPVRLSGAQVRSPGSFAGPKGVDPRTYAALPALLQNALRGHRSRERLQRFAEISSYPTLQAAALNLGLNQPTLSSQIRNLERKVGGQLLMRADRWQPMQLTTLGSELLKVAQENGMITR